jgi:hypothetical protein
MEEATFETVLCGRVVAAGKEYPTWLPALNYQYTDIILSMY